MRTGRSVIPLIVLFAFAALSCFAEESAGILEKIRNGMGTVSTLQADFVQRKRIAALKHTLTIRGELALDRNGRMAWRVHSPMRYVCLIDGNSLTQWDEDSNSVLKLDASKNPALQVLAKSMGRYFAGRFDEMADEFSISVQGPLSLRLVPRGESVISRFIREIEVETSPDYSFITRVVIRETNVRLSWKTREPSDETFRSD